MPPPTIAPPKVRADPFVSTLVAELRVAPPVPKLMTASIDVIEPPSEDAALPVKVKPPLNAIVSAKLFPS